jgi:hypothetical protein
LPFLVPLLLKLLLLLLVFLIGLRICFAAAGCGIGRHESTEGTST